MHLVESNLKQILNWKKKKKKETEKKNLGCSNACRNQGAIIKDKLAMDLCHDAIWQPKKYF